MRRNSSTAGWAYSGDTTSGSGRVSIGDVVELRRGDQDAQAPDHVPRHVPQMTEPRMRIALGNREPVAQLRAHEPRSHEQGRELLAHLCAEQPAAHRAQQHRPGRSLGAQRDFGCEPQCCRSRTVSPQIVGHGVGERIAAESRVAAVAGEHRRGVALGRQTMLDRASDQIAEQRQRLGAGRSRTRSASETSAGAIGHSRCSKPACSAARRAQGRSSERPCGLKYV